MGMLAPIKIGVRVLKPTHPVLVLLKFEIPFRFVGKVDAAGQGTHDNLICLPNQRKFGSFILFLHSIHLLSLYRLQSPLSRRLPNVT
jgi:hypothetical protein